MQDDIPTTLVEAVVTCHTPGCYSEGIAIAVLMVQDTGIAVCGVCGQIIDDVQMVE